MQTDPFAAIRKFDTGKSTSFAASEHPEHRQIQPVFPEKSSQDNAVTPGTPGTPKIHGRADVDQYLPDEWRRGLRDLRRMDLPRGARRAAWDRLVRDAHWLAWEWHADPIVAGWSVGDLFGFDPDNCEPSGLLLSIRGDRVACFIEDGARSAAVIRAGMSGPIRFFWRPCTAAAPIWAHREREGGE